MRILVTNDDGINAPGLQVLKAIASKLIDPTGELWVVAPAQEASGVAHSVSLHDPLLLSEVSPKHWALEGSPADCVIAAIHHVMGEPPDLILCGINRGNNSAENALYSGTLGAAMEGSLQGIPSIALSQYLGPKNATAHDPFEAARLHSHRAIDLCMQAGFSCDTPYPLFYNVNFPPCSGDEVQGVCASPQGRRSGVVFTGAPSVSPGGRTCLWIGRRDASNKRASRVRTQSGIWPGSFPSRRCAPTCQIGTGLRGLSK